MRREDKWIRFVEGHALAAMRKRGISREQAKEVVRKPDTIRKAKNQARESAKRYEKRFSARSRIAVIADERSTEIWIVTAFPV